MILGEQLPSWKQIIGRKKKSNEKGYYEIDGSYFFVQSCMSLNVIINAYKKINSLDKVYVWIPDYFCDETIKSFKEKWMEILYYPIDIQFNPNQSWIKEHSKEIKIDIFVFVHYFGKFHESVSFVKQICDNNHAILIEDCAHVLYPTGKIGKNGDFVIYSPHKLLPVSDGAILGVNRKEKNDGICSEIAEIYKQKDVKHDDLSWYLKKSIQKIFHIHRTISYYNGVHFGKNAGSFKLPKKISNSAANALSNYNYIRLKEIAFRRRNNLEVMNYIMKKLYPNIIPMIDKNVEVPYVAVYSLENCENKEKVIRELIGNGFTVLYWPDLPHELIGENGHDVAKVLSENIIVMPIHQGIRTQYLLKTFLSVGNQKEKKDLYLDWLDNSNESRNRYNHIANLVEFPNIPQEWEYGRVKANIEGWQVERAIIMFKNREIGIIQILIKKKGGVKILARINRGPALIDGFNSAVIHIDIIELARKHISTYFYLPFVIAPNVILNGKNLSKFTNAGWKQWNEFGFQSGSINLSLETEDSLRQRLDSKWRNQLRTSEKKQLTVKSDFDRFDEILDIYELSQKEKHFSGIPRKMLVSLHEIKESPLELTYIENDGEIIAFDIFYVTPGFGLYLVGWNGEKGRSLYANNLLLYKQAENLLNKGVKWMDLGGIDYVYTEENARFKDGMKPEHYQLMGEFVK